MTLPPTLELAAGTLDLRDGRFVRADGAEERLTDTELRLVRYLADRAGTAVPREELEQQVWGYRPGVLSRTVFTTVGRVRAKLEAEPGSPRHLLTAPGAGYTWTAAATPSTPPRRTHLPVDLSPFVGRADVLSTLLRALDEARVVSVLGPGGVGKTRLAIELARRTHCDVVFVPLEPVEHVAQVPAAVATALGVSLGGRSEPWAELPELTGDGPLLCILDNAEHLTGLGEPLSRWLVASPRLRLLVTSRIRLGLRTEVALTVPPLSVPPPGTALEQSEAGALLLQHARRSRPGWVPADAEAEDLGALCRGVGGNPLALELAAAWLRVLEPAEVLAEVGTGAVLVSLDHDLPARHRSIEAMLSASWRLLSPPAARALEALGACCGPFDRATALQVAGADLSVLGQLVDASMVHRAGPRFDLHPLVRQHARARLADRPDADDVRARHARWFLSRLHDEVGRADDGGSEQAAQAAVSAFHEDVIAAWSNRARAGDAPALAAVAYRLYRYLDLRNRFTELTEALAEARAALVAPTPEVTAVREAVVLLGAGAGVAVPGSTAGVVDAVRGAPDELRTAALVHGAIAALQGGDASGAVDLADRAVSSTVAGGGRFLEAFARTVRGAAHLRAGRIDAARADVTAALATHTEGRAFARPAVHLGEIELFAGDALRARDQLEVALAACRASDDRSFAALALCRLGAALALGGVDATAVCVEAIEEGVTSRLPRVWWAGALAQLGEAWSTHADPRTVTDGVVLLAAAASGPSMEPPGALAARLEAARGRVDPRHWAAAVAAGRAATDAALLARVRRESHPMAADGSTEVPSARLADSRATE